MSLLDIIIPQYNENDEMVSQLLDSINMQKGIDFNDINIVIINDCSNVLLSTELFYNYPKLKVKYLKMEKNSGPGVTRQFGVDNTKSPYVTFIDADAAFTVIGNIINETRILIIKFFIFFINFLFSIVQYSLYLKYFFELLINLVH